MTEALIKCLCTEIRIPDLGITLKKGDEEWVDEGKARRSLDLQHARAIQAVKVEWRERCRVTKPPSPPFMKRLKPRFGTPAVVEDPNPPPTAPTQASKRQDAQEAATAAVAKELAELKATIQAQQAAAGGVEAAVERAMQKVLAGLPTAPTAAAVADDEPVFIPSNIVDKGKREDIAVSTEESHGGSVDDAAEALKAVKKKTPRRRRTPKKKEA